MLIEGRDVQRQRLLVAEIGNNHEGDGQAALEMVAAAAEAGADAVKVQIITPERLVHASQRERIAQLSRFRLPDATYEAMAALARTRGMLFIATPFDVHTLEQFAPLLSAVKIASGDLDYTPLLAAAARTRKPLILSTGMGTMTEVSAAVRTIEQYLPADQSLEASLVLLHCVSAYPTPLDQANLRALERLRVAFGLVVGYSDHTLGIEASLVAAALGARIIEKHFTLDKTRATFRDHALSADPQELRRLATILHAFDSMLGDGEKRPMPCEQPAVTAARRSAVVSHDLPAGKRLSFDDLIFVRPRNGLTPTAALAMVGRSVRTPLGKNEFLQAYHLASEK